MQQRKRPRGFLGFGSRGWATWTSNKWELVECPERVGRPDTAVVGRPESLAQRDGSSGGGGFVEDDGVKVSSGLVSSLVSVCSSQARRGGVDEGRQTAARWSVKE